MDPSPGKAARPAVSRSTTVDREKPAALALPPSEGSHVLADLSRPRQPGKGHNTTKDEEHKVSNERNKSLITAGVLIDAMKTLEPTEMLSLIHI